MGYLKAAIMILSFISFFSYGYGEKLVTCQIIDKTSNNRYKVECREGHQGFIQYYTEIKNVKLAPEEGDANPIVIDNAEVSDIASLKYSLAEIVQEQGLEVEIDPETDYSVESFDVSIDTTLWADSDFTHPLVKAGISSIDETCFYSFLSEDTKIVSLQVRNRRVEICRSQMFCDLPQGLTEGNVWCQTENGQCPEVGKCIAGVTRGIEIEDIDRALQGR